MLISTSKNENHRLPESYHEFSLKAFEPAHSNSNEINLVLSSLFTKYSDLGTYLPIDSNYSKAET